MARIRTIKPAFFRHADLFEAEQQSGFPLRVAFAGLWTAADREGRFKWKPRELKLDCLPHDALDFEAVLLALARHGFIKRYEHNGGQFAFIPSWSDHQVINQREAQSDLPDPGSATHVHARADTFDAGNAPNGVNVPESIRATVLARDGKCLRCEAMDDLTVDHIFPRCIGGTHALTNLRTLCRSCNSARPVAGQGLIDDLARDGLTLQDMQRTCVHVQARGEGKGKGRGKEGELIGDGVVERASDPIPRHEREPAPAPAPAKKSGSMVTEDAFSITDEILLAMGKETDDPMAIGAPYLVQKWLNENISRDAILLGVTKAMANRKNDPPSTFNYFEKAVLRASVELARPLPKIEVRQQETLRVITNAKTQSGGSLIESIKRELAELEQSEGADIALPGGPLRRISG